MSNNNNKTVPSFSTATCHQHRYQESILQCSHKILHRLLASSVGWLLRSTLKNMNSLHRRAGKLILPDPSLSTKQKMRALGILNIPLQLDYNKGIFMHKGFSNNSTNYLAQLFISHQSHYTNSWNNRYVPKPRLVYLKLAYPLLERPSGTPCLKTKSCISLP